MAHHTEAERKWEVNQQSLLQQIAETNRLLLDERKVKEESVFAFKSSEEYYGELFE